MNAYASPYTDNGVDIMTRRVASAFGTDVQIEVVDPFDVRLRREYRQHLKGLHESPLKLICVQCGHKSDNLCAIYFKDEVGMAHFLKMNPDLVSPLVTVWAGWRVVWLRVLDWSLENTGFANGLWSGDGLAPVSIVVDRAAASDFAPFGNILSTTYAAMKWPKSLEDNFFAQFIASQFGQIITQGYRKSGRLNQTIYAQVLAYKLDLFYDVDEKVFIIRYSDETCARFSVETIRQNVAKDVRLLQLNDPQISINEFSQARIKALVDEIKKVAAFNRRDGLLDTFASQYRWPLALESLPVS